MFQWNIKLQRTWHFKRITPSQAFPLAIKKNARTSNCSWIIWDSSLLKNYHKRPISSLRTKPAHKSSKYLLIYVRLPNSTKPLYLVSISNGYKTQLKKMSYNLFITIWSPKKKCSSESQSPFVDFHLKRPRKSKKSFKIAKDTQ